MKLGTEKYSYCSGELHLKSKPAIAQEIDDIIANSGESIGTLSCEQFVELLREAFVKKGWEIPPPILDKRGSQIPVMDFRKDGVGVQLGLNSRSSDIDILKLQAAHNLEETNIDLGVYIVTTAEFQQQLASYTQRSWSGPTLQAIERKMQTLGRLVQIPICVIGLQLFEVKKRFVDLSSMSPAQIKDLVIEFLEDKYNTKINREVSEIGAGAEIGFDGIIRSKEANVVIAIELSKYGILRSKLLTDSVRILAKEVRAYQKASGRKATLVFVLVCDFSYTYIESILGNGNLPHGWVEDIDFGYRLFSFDELAKYLESKQSLVQV